MLWPLFLLLTACEKEELPVKPYDRGDAEEIVIPIGADYGQQVWFDLGTKSIVSTNEKLSWDFAFDCRDSAHYIYLNTSLAMMAAPTGQTDFEAPIDEAALRFRPDHSAGSLDSLALGKWWESNEVFLLDLGFRLNGNPRGKRKVQFFLEDDALRFVLADLDGSNRQEGRLEKQPGYGRVAYSIRDAAPVQIEPGVDDYDLVFTQYTYAFYNPYTPYLVTGVLNNPRLQGSAEITHKLFEEVSLEDAMGADLQDSLDLIGYDWKVYDFDQGSYTIFSDKIYVVRDAEGFYYKLHFLDFYNERGERGYPSLRIQQL
jgi:hypothetical protein